MNKLFLIALIFSIGGIFALTLISEFVEIEPINIIDAENKVEQRVLLEGTITKLTQKTNVNFLELKDSTGQINIVIFDKIDKINKTSQIIVEGQVKIYRGELEIIANRIELK